MNYTFEKHLKSLSEVDKDYELLYSIWDLNKKNLTQGLNLISSSFPHYSGHDVSHSMTIINNIQCFLGEERIKRLGATDTFLLLMACLTHDIGMILTYRIIEEEWQDKKFKTLLEELTSSADSVIAEASKLLLLHSKKGNNAGLDNFKWALEIKNAVTIITAELFRHKHTKQGSDNLLINKEFKELADNFYSTQLPNRFIDLLANIAFLHGENFDKVLSKLYSKANGLKGDYIHPRFIACMIRLGDLLDFDSNRFNSYSIATIKKMPDVSLLHQQKHASVKHMLVSPNSIEVELNCMDEDVYRISKNWFDWLENEVNNQSREWTNIAPEDLGGLPPVISKDSIRILYNGIQASSELLNLKFTMSQKKIFSILQGGGIYKEPGFVFIREIVQNAFDASKIQMWRDFKEGVYDFHFDNTNGDFKPEFPNDITADIYKQYPVTLKVRWKDVDKSVLHFECTDRGTGISESTLLRMTKHVGESYNNDLGYKDLYEGMPYWLRPTAAFGVGLQSIFFVAPTFEVETSYLGETTKRIVFRSAADNQYSSIVEENIVKSRGTTIKVDIPKDRFAELFGTSFSWDVLDSVDVFKGNGDDIYLGKIDNFVLRTFDGIENLNFNYVAEDDERSFSRSINSGYLENYDTNGNYRYSCKYEQGVLLFEVYEKEFGSTFKVWFSESMECNTLQHRLMVRDIIVSNAKFYYYKTEYLGFEWNLNNQRTDKVIDISRDNLTYNGNQWVTDTLLNKLLPHILKLIEDMFKKKLSAGQEEVSTFKIQYLNYCLTAYACRIHSIDLEPLTDVVIPSDIASYNKNGVNAKDLLCAKELYVIDGFKTNGHNKILAEEKEKIEVDHSSLIADKIVVWGNSYLHSFLMFNYICTDVSIYDQGCHIYKLKRISEIKGVTMVESHDDNYLLALEKSSFHECSRSSIYGLKKYPNIVVKLSYVSGFERFPNYSTCCIFSPFSAKAKAKDLYDVVKALPDDKIKEYIRNNLSSYITPSMMEVLISANINDNITEEQVRDEYLNLIFDFVKMKQRISLGESKE